MKKKLPLQLTSRNIVCSFLTVLSLFLLISCEVEEKDRVAGTGYLSLDVQSDATYATKAYTDPLDVNEYTVEVYKGTELLTSFLYNERPDELELEIGEYTASTFWGENVAAAIGENFIYLEGSENFTILEGQTQTVILNPTPANARIEFEYSDELQFVYTDWFIDMSTSHMDEPLTYKREYTDPAFFKVNSQGQSLKLDMHFYVNEEEYNYSYTEMIQPRDSVNFSLTLAEGEDPEPGDDYPSISAEVFYHEFIAENPANVEIKITTNCSDYSIIKAGDWFTAAKTSDGNLLLLSQPNTTTIARSGSVTLQAVNEKGVAIAVVGVLQKAKGDTGSGTAEPYIFAMNNAISAVTYDQYPITVRTNDEDWTAELENNANAVWLKVTPSEEGILITTLNDNSGTNSRTANVILKATLNGQTATDVIAVTQMVSDPEISVNPASLILETDGLQKEISIESNTNWSYSYPEEDKKWLTITKDGDKLQVEATAISSEQSRTSIITLTASTTDGRATHVNIPVTQQGLSRPKLKLTITIDKSTTVVELDEDYILDDPGIGKPTLSYPAGFNPAAINIIKGEARSAFINVRVPGKMGSCTLSYLSGSPAYNLLDGLNLSGAVCSMNTANTLGVIYLDSFLNNQISGTYYYTLTVIDQMNKEESVMLIINVEEN